MTQELDVFISGDGIVGRSLALLLAREKLRIGLSENPARTQATKALPETRAYAITPASRALLESVRGWPEDDAVATPVLNMQVHGDGDSELNFSALTQGLDALNWIVDATVLEDRLAEVLRYQPQIERIPAGANPKALLTIVCEGRGSATRAALGVEFKTAPYGQHALATRVRCERPHAQTAYQWFLPADEALGTQQGEIIGLLQQGGPQGLEVAVVWSASPERSKALLDLSPEDFCKALEAACGKALGTMELISERRAWTLQRAQAERWTGQGLDGAWVLAGDAAHNVHPLAGQGLNLGLDDVAELARVIREREPWRSVGDAKLLRRYERARKADMLALDTGMDALQRLYAREGQAWRVLRNWGLRGVEKSGWLKHFLIQKAVGVTA